MLAYQGLLLLCLGGYAASQTTAVGTGQNPTAATQAPATAAGAQNPTAAGGAQTPAPNPQAPPTSSGNAAGTTTASDPEWVNTLQTTFGDIMNNCTLSSTNQVNPCQQNTTAIQAATTKSARCSVWDDMKKCIRDNCKYTYEDSLEKLDAYCGSCAVKATFAWIGVLAILAMYFKF